MTIIFIYTDPTPLARTKFSAGKVYNPRKTVLAKRVASLYMQNEFDRKKPYSEPIKVSIEFLFKRTKSAKKEERTWKSVKPDIDNLAKLYLDSGNGILWEDDNIICELHLKKMMCAKNEKPHVKITIDTL
jgi:Holliday junction resolvase RusA-like endonuclease